MCAHQLQNKRKTPCEDGESAKRGLLFSETSPVLTRPERTLSEEEAMTPKDTQKSQITVYKCTQRQKTFIPGDLSCGLMKLKLNCLAIMIIITLGEKRGKFASLRTPSQLRIMGVAASCCGSVLLQEGLFQKTDGIMWKETYEEILKQYDISLEVQVWAQTSSIWVFRWTMTLTTPPN